jgi:hypothetical protein
VDQRPTTTTTIGYAEKSTCSIKLCQEHESDARQHEQLQKWQAKQQAGKNHENEPHGLEMKALSNCGD